MSDQDFRSSTVRADDVSCNFYVFDKKYHQSFKAFQPIKVEIKFDGDILNGINRYALVLINKLVSINSDGEKHFDLI